jgi:3-phenylpropionate/trans-cinnamate dioxygenase ferredoxin component
VGSLERGGWGGGGPPHRESVAESAEAPHPSNAHAIAPDAGAGFVDVAAQHELAEGALLGVTLPTGAAVCLYNDRGRIGAIGNVCTHAEFLMSDGVLHGDGTLECIWHGARFDCATGAVRRHPASEPLPVYPVRLEAGRVLVGVEPEVPPRPSPPAP